MVKRIGLGLIGCGLIARAVHMPALAASGDCSVLAACDLHDPGKAVAARHFQGARLLRNTADIYDDPEITAVVIALPPSENRAAALEALEAGRDVYIEKPLAGTLEDGMAIAEAAKASDRITMIGFNFRRNHAALAARKAIEAGEVGEIISIQTQNHTMQPQEIWKQDPEKYWRTDPGKGGGALSDLASHHIDFAHLLTGSLTESVSATIRSRVTTADCAEVRLQLGNGAVCQISAILGAGRHVNKLTVTGTKGQFEIDLCDPAPARVRSGQPGYSRGTRLRTELTDFAPVAALNARPGEPSFGDALAAFFAACRSRDRAVEPSLEAGVEVLKVIDMAYRSHEAGGALIQRTAQHTDGA